MPPPVPDPRRAAVLAVGDELLAGAHPDLNSPFVASELLELGISTLETRAVGDDEVAIGRAVAELARAHGLVVVTGGLGPTLDDVTRQGVAQAAGVRVRFDEGAWQEVLAWYARSGRECPESNRRQALLPDGARVLTNPTGTAPGCALDVAGARVLVLPGPPHEVRAMWPSVVELELRARTPPGAARLVHTFHLEGMSESLFADRSGDWVARGANPLMGVTVKDGVLTARLVATAPDEGAARALLEPRVAEFRARFGAHLFSEHTPDPARELGRELLEGGVSVTAAESCTGGLVAAALCSVPGISALLREAWVTYADGAKVERLGVDPELLSRHGAVSPEVARAMAAGAAERAGARLALSTTGVAGPDGGSDEKPVGLVWFGVCLDGETFVEERRWPPRASRERIRGWATQHALVLGLRALRGTLADRG